MTKNKKPPANARFFENATLWFEKSLRKIIAVVKQNKESNAADILTLYPIIISKGPTISRIIAGIKKKPGTPKLSIHSIVPS